MATSREDARPLQRCGWRADGRLRSPGTYTTSWDANINTGLPSYVGAGQDARERAIAVQEAVFTAWAGRE